MVMFRGRGGRGGGRGRGAPAPHMMHSVPPMRLKPGRGLPPRGRPMAPRGGPLAYGGPPRPMAPRQGPPYAPERRMMRPPMSAGPYGRPAPPDMMGAPYPPRGAYRGRGGPTRGRGGASRGRGGPPRGRGGPTRGRGAARGGKSAAPANQQSKVVKKPSKSEKERDDSVMKKPWVTPELCEEIKKKQEMHTRSRESEDPKHFEEFKAQRNKVTAMLRAAKMEYIGQHEEQDVLKIMAEAGKKQATNASNTSAAAKTEPKAAENGAGTDAGQGDNGSVAEPPAENGVHAEPAAA